VSKYKSVGAGTLAEQIERYSCDGVEDLIKQPDEHISFVESVGGAAEKELPAPDEEQAPDGEQAPDEDLGIEWGTEDICEIEGL
jgi:hypothetical protein